MSDLHLWLDPMQFPARLIRFRKEQGLTQQGLADAAQLHVNQIKRYEAGTGQPTLDALVRLARSLHLSLDDLVFEEGERGPDADMALLFEAISEFSEEEKQTVRTVLSGMVLQHSARRWDTRKSPAKERP